MENIYKSKNDFWLYLEPYVYMAKTPNKILLYNTLDACCIIINEKIIIEIIEKLYLKDNCGVTKVSLVDNDVIRRFIQLLREKFMGDIIKIVDNSLKPVQLMPYLKLINNDKKRIDSNEMLTKKDFSSYLHHITFYINTKQNTVYEEDDLWRQIDSPIHFSGDVIKYDDLRNFLISLPETINTYKFIINDLFIDSEWNNLIQLCNTFTSKIIFVLYYNNIDNIIKLINNLPTNSSLKLLIKFPIDDKIFELLLTLLNESNTEYEINFLVSSEQDCAKIDLLDETYNFDNSTVTPIITYPSSFFKNEVYINESDLFHEPLTMRNIHAHEIINTNFFGRISVMPNGIIVANNNHKPIGSIKDSINDIIVNELKNGESWFLLRDQQPCNECIYQRLCPSPSNYEIVLDKPNLCNIIEHIRN